MDTFKSALGSAGDCCRFFVYLLTWNPERGKFDKRPVGSVASATMTFAQAHAEAMRQRSIGQLATVGLGVTKDSGLFFVDIDALPADYTPDERTQQLLTMFPGAFVEWSSSKRGLHIVGRMATPVPHSCRNDALHLELYTEERGIALNIDATPSGSMDSVHDVSAAVAQFFPPRGIPGATVGARPEWRGPGDDDELIERMLAAKKSAAAAFGGKASLPELWRGEVGSDDRSRDDAALALHLAYWCGCDQERMTRLMWRSGLVRDKWREHHTYLAMTVANACAACTNVYQERAAKEPPQLPTPAPEIRSAADLLRQEFKPVQWAIRDLIPEGVTIISGDPKIGKSWLVYQACLVVATGSALWHGRAPETQGDALMLALEDNERRLRRRLDKLLEAFPGKSPERLHYVTDWPRAEAGVAKLREFLSTHPECRICVIDTVSAFRDTDPGRKSAYAHDYAVGEMLKPLAREFNCAVVLVMHNRKQTAGDVMHKVSGTQGMTGSVDNVLVLERGRGETDAVLHVDGRDIEQQQELALRLNQGVWSFLGNADDVQRSKERNAVLKAIRVSLKGAGTAIEIHEAIGGAVTLGAIKTRLSRMCAAGEVERNGKIYTLPDPAEKFTPLFLPLPGAATSKL